MADIAFLQTNGNHSARAQDLLLQTLAERAVQVAVVAEPYWVPPRPDWAGDRDGLVAITTQSPASSLTLERVVQGSGYVAAQVGELVIVGVYFSPNRAFAEFEVFLDEVGTLVGQSHPRSVIVLGDLNAKSAAWGSSTTDVRGRAVGEWLVEVGLCVLNQGTTETCVRRWGGSVVDVTFATPELARRCSGWEVLADEETLSDHRYISFRVAPSSSGSTGRISQPIGPRWSLRHLQRDLLEEAALFQEWLPSEPTGLDEEAAALCEAMARICDACMPRVRAPPSKRQVYWWTDEIAELRRRCVRRRRRYQRYRRRRRTETDVADALYDAYREASKALRAAIDRSKADAWNQLLASLERDPWGRPYRLVRRKLRPWAPPVTSTLQPLVLCRVVEGLFPGSPGTGFAPPTMAAPLQPPPRVEEDVPDVSEGELGAAILRMRAKDTAPGPDGVPGRAWALALSAALKPRLLALFSRCMREGRFPRRWKEGRLVLLRKEGRPADEPAGYRPIVLLDEAGKLLERVVVARLIKHLDGDGPDLSDRQFGFRRGRSTLEAISCVRDLSEAACSSGGVLLAVSLDIANAFNTLPWTTITEAMKFHRVPRYLMSLVGDYLSSREVVYPTMRGECRSPMTRGVPQGSALGPLLWNIGYDWVLRGANLPGVGVICYADDTLVTARGGTFRDASILATAGVAAVVARIRRLGLEVALGKSEAICFHGPRRAPPAGANIVVGGVRIAVGSTLRYLGVVLESRWRFGTHIQRLSPKLMGTAGALSRLLPNLGGGNGSCRRLYTAVVCSMAMYGAPIWAGSLDHKEVALLHRVQRKLAVRVCRGYRTLSHEVATALAGSLPWDLEAEVLSSVYRRRARAREQDLRPVPREIEKWREEARSEALTRWKGRILAGPTQRGVGARRLLEAVKPRLKEWVQRRHGSLTFRLTQVLSGHGCFGRYLCNVARREATPACHECGCAEDTAQHVLEECPDGAVQRRELVGVLGSDLSLSTIIAKMVDSERNWEAMISFCESVISQKETNERERERDPGSLPQRRARTRGRANRARTPSPLGRPGALDAGASNVP